MGKGEFHQTRESQACSLFPLVMPNMSFFSFGFPCKAKSRQRKCFVPFWFPFKPTTQRIGTCLTRHKLILSKSALDQMGRPLLPQGSQQLDRVNGLDALRSREVVRKHPRILATVGFHHVSRLNSPGFMIPPWLCDLCFATQSQDWLNAPSPLQKGNTASGHHPFRMPYFKQPDPCWEPTWLVSFGLPFSQPSYKLAFPCNHD